MTEFDTYQGASTVSLKTMLSAEIKNAGAMCLHYPIHLHGVVLA
jgi:hypothetical protein